MIFFFCPPLGATRQSDGFEPGLVYQPHVPKTQEGCQPGRGAEQSCLPQGGLVGEPNQKYRLETPFNWCLRRKTLDVVHMWASHMNLCRVEVWRSGLPATQEERGNDQSECECERRILNMTTQPRPKDGLVLEINVYKQLSYKVSSIVSIFFKTLFIQLLSINAPLVSKMFSPLFTGHMIKHFLNLLKTKLNIFMFFFLLIRMLTDWLQTQFENQVFFDSNII